MKILFVGQIAEGQTSKMRMDVLGELGNTIVAFNSQKVWNDLSWLSSKIQQKVNFGSAVINLNKTVLKLAREHHPDLFWGEKQEYLWPETLSEMHHMGIRTLHFTPDPYFTLKWKRTRLMDRCISLFDYVITSKAYELDAYKNHCRNVIYMPLGYAEAVHRPLLPADRVVRRTFQSDVGFIGGWEPRREHLLDCIAKQVDCNLKLWGYGWDHIRDGRWTPRRAYRLKLLAGKDSFCIQRNARLATSLQGSEVYGDKYAWAISGARISLGFLRHVCPDQHTTRTFEIPACASMMIADRTEEHQAFFKEGTEADFFSTEEELVEKIRFYLKNETLREKVALQGYHRSQKSGYSYKERLKQVIAQLN